MSKISLEGNASGSGTLTIAAPNTNSNFTLTLPTNTGTIVTQNSTPAFASTIGVGGATPSSSGAGITFPANESASTNANTLDDYEEGTWTPTIGGTTNPTGISYSLQSGTYTKIGRMVYITFRVNFSFNSGTGSGGVRINGLPFTAANAIHPKTPPQQDNITFTGYAYLEMGAEPGNTYIVLGKNRSNNTAAGVAITDLNAAGTDINGGVFYYV